MGQKTIEALKDTFSDGKTPTGSDFGDILDSYLHKSVKISQSQVLGLNEDFATKRELKNATTNNKGIYSTVAQLQAANPPVNNIKGFFGFVGTQNPFRKFEVQADNGTWIDTGEDINIADIDLADYAKLNEVETLSGVPVLKNKLYGTDFSEQEIISADYNGNYLTGKTTIFYEKQDVLRNKKITAIRANFCKIGSFSVFKAKGVNTSNYRVLETQILRVNKTGIQIVALDNPMQIDKDEWFGFYSVEDTAEYYLNDKITDNPIAGGFYHTKDKGATWHKLHGDTGVGTLIGDIRIGDIAILQDRITAIENIAINELDTIVVSTCDYSTDFLALVPNDDTLKNVAGAIRYCAETLWAYCPDVKIVFVTPPYLGGSSADEAHVFNKKLNNINYQMLHVAEWLSCNIIDLTHTCGIAPIMEIGSHKYLSDYVHPNSSGGTLIGKTIGNQLLNILGGNSIDGAIALMGDSLTTEDWNNNEWLASFDKIIQYPKRLNYAQSGATWSHRGATKYNLHNKWGVWNDDNVIWNQINRLIYDIKNNNQIIPDILIIMAGTNDATITI